MLTCAIFAVMLKEQPPLRLHLDLLYVQESLWNDHPALSYSFTETVGDSIGYKISGDSKVRPGRTKLVYVTTGYLLQVLVNNPEQISSYTHLILDEVHERDVDSDLLSLVVKLQMSGYGFKLVIMSATLQGDLFTRYFSEKKIKTIFVGVKRYPVEVVHIEQLLDRFGGRSGDFMMKSEGTRGYQPVAQASAQRGGLETCARHSRHRVEIMLRIAWNEVQPPEYLGLDGSGAPKKDKNSAGELRRPKSSRGPWENFRSTTTSNTVGGGGRVGSPTRMSRRQAPLKEPKATGCQKAPTASLIPRDGGRVAALQARTKELCAQREEAAERERLLRTDLLKAEEEIANLTKELENVRKVLEAEFARRTEAEQQLELKSMHLEDLPSIVAEEPLQRPVGVSQEWFRVSELMRRTRLQSTEGKVDVGFDIQSLPLSVPASVSQSVHGSEPDEMPGSKRSEGIASPWLLNRAVRHCPLGLSEISLSEAESFSVTESAPFAGNAYRAIKDAERAFGTGGREAEGWEEENVKVKGEFDSDSDDETDVQEQMSEMPEAHHRVRRQPGPGPPDRWFDETAESETPTQDAIVTPSEHGQSDGGGLRSNRPNRHQRRAARLGRSERPLAASEPEQESRTIRDLRKLLKDKESSDRGSWTSERGPEKGVKWRGGTPPAPPKCSKDDLRAFSKFSAE
eukprot:s781_g4.t1